jgi:2-hydroxychromene-2-carboxylate isomerase
MSLRTTLTALAAAHITSSQRLEARRAQAERTRRGRGDPHLVSSFHQVDDPYSHLLVQAMGRFAAAYDVKVQPYLVGPPADWAMPERALAIAYARQDAARLARRAGLDFIDPGHQPYPEATAHAGATLTAALATGAFWTTAQEVGRALWTGQPQAAAAGADYAAACAAGEQERHRLRHFMSAAVHYGGEWYTGVDRLHYLEARLDGLGVRRGGSGPVFAPPLVPAGSGRLAGAAKPVLHYYLSFRSPYTYLAAGQVKALADAYGAELRLRFVLPMMMRGLPVPPMKKMYFTLDAAREARRLGVPFGRIADPLGRPVERGYALLNYALEQGKGFEFAMSFMRHVWSEGVDAGSDQGLARIVRAAGLDWAVARQHLGDESWRATAEANRAEMTALGLWGVPCFRVGDTAVWGQDRLWVIEDALKAMAVPG